MNCLPTIGEPSWLSTLSMLALAPVPTRAYGVSRFSALLPDSYLHEIAVAAMGALVLAILIIVRRWRGRLKRMQEQRNELALAVMLRTREIRREKETVVRQKRQIEELLEKAQQSNRAKDEFLANISHEIRTPLHGVIGMTDLALHTGLTAEQREYLQLVDSSAKSLLVLVNDVLDFSKIEAGELTLECLPLSVIEFVQTATAPFAIRANNKELEFDVKIDSDVPKTIEADPLRVQQVLNNLLSNSVKFTERGSIRLHVSRDAASDDLRFEVRDTGIGIAKQHLEAVFEPFRQADGSTTRKYGGTGLGLTICLRLARQMGGELTVESDEGVGSTFTFRLPAQPSQKNEANGDAQMELATDNAS